MLHSSTEIIGHLEGLALLKKIYRGASLDSTSQMGCSGLHDYHH